MCFAFDIMNQAPYMQLMSVWPESGNNTTMVYAKRFFYKKIFNINKLNNNQALLKAQEVYCETNLEH